MYDSILNLRFHKKMVDQGTKKSSVSDGIQSRNTAILDLNVLITELKC